MMGIKNKTKYHKKLSSHVDNNISELPECEYVEISSVTHTHTHINTQLERIKILHT